MRPVSANGGRVCPKSSKNPRSRSRSPSKAPKNTSNPNFLYEVGTLGSGLQTMHVHTKNHTVEVETDYPDPSPGPKQFIKFVKDTFQDNPKVYRKFVYILSQVQYKDTDKLDLIKRVITLFDGYPYLILGFNAFLPSDYSIEIQDDAVVIKVFESVSNLGDIDTGHFRNYDSKDLSNTLLKTTELGFTGDDTIAYIHQVKEMYGDEPMRYNRFKEILKEFHSKKVDEIETIHTIVSLFHKYPHLIVGFNAFLPHGYHIAMHNDSYDVEYPGHHEGEITVVNFKKKY